MVAELETGPEHTLGQLFAALLAHAADPTMLTRPSGEILRANPAACRALGRSEDELRSLGRAGVVRRTPELDQLMADRARDGKASGEILFERSDGCTFPAQVTSTIITHGGAPPFTLLVFRDVSEERRLERELRASEARFRAAFDTLPDAVTLTDAITARFFAVNEGAQHVTGWAPQEMVGRTSIELGLWADEDRDAFLARLRADGALRDFATHLRRKDGSTIDVQLFAQPLRVDGRDLLLTITRDISAQRRAERDRDEFQRQLHQSQKLEAVGRLAGGVAHDFNNLLTVIMGCSEELRSALDRGEPIRREDLTEITDTAERARDLTSQLLAFAGKPSLRPARVDLNAIVQRSQKLLRRVIGEDVALEVQTAPSPAFVRSDPVQIEQVIFNLAINARDALPNGGRLTFAVRVSPREATATDPRHVELRVMDDGVGMAPEVADRIFEPFFTTKPPRQGTGLGLSTVHGVVTQLGGEIRVDTQLGVGTTFQLSFPECPEADPTPPPRAPALSSGGTEAVLLVEDEAAVRKVLARVCRRSGYRVTEAPTAERALELVAEGHEFDVLLTDLVMPAMNGRELIRRVRAVRPACACVLMSGYAPDSTTAEAVVDSDVALLAKPCTSEELRATLREVLDAARESGARESRARPR